MSARARRAGTRIDASSDPGSIATRCWANVPGADLCGRGVVQHVGQVLVQVAAADNVQQLHPAADAEHRHVALEGGAQQIASSARSRCGQTGVDSAWASCP